ncbi:MAG: YdcF family protein [Campylobacterales bacterium]|nr:YdcF family protein [Campylobacterales bacterium]
MEFGFFLKKFISFFVEPLGIVLLLFSLGVYFMYARKERVAKLFSITGLVALFLFSYPPFANALVEILEDKYPKFLYVNVHSSEDIEYIHVLGGGHTTDETQPISSQLSDASTKRVLEGVLIARNMKNTQLIFTGFAGKTDTPTAIMNARLASALGIKKERMLINVLPKDTLEEALYAQSIIGEKPFLLVTSATHMPRAMQLFESLGMHPIAAPTDFHKEKFLGYMVAPDAFYFRVSTIAIHEYIGLLWNTLKG